MLDEFDHRALGQRLRLFHLQEESAGSVCWHPRGWVAYRLLEDRLRRHLERDGYQEVRSPQVWSESLWRRSGHWQHFRDGMLSVAAGDPEAAVAGGHFPCGGSEPEAPPPAALAWALKPVSCPGHIEL